MFHETQRFQCVSGAFFTDSDFFHGKEKPVSGHLILPDLSQITAYRKEAK